MYNRDILDLLFSRIEHTLALIQALIGPRQVGKTTLARQVQESTQLPCVYASADSAGLHESSWIQAQWNMARQKLRSAPRVLLILDEVQKLPNWSVWVKQL